MTRREEPIFRRGADIIRPPTKTEYGMHEIRVRDLNGYILGFGRGID